MATKKPKIDRETDNVPVAGVTAVYEDDTGFNAFGDELVDEEDE